MKPYVIAYDIARGSMAAQKLPEGENSSIRCGELRLHEDAPLAGTWDPPEMRWVDPRLPTTDFFDFAVFVLGVTRKVYEIEEIRRELEKTGEFLPVRFGADIHYLWHPTVVFQDYDWALSDNDGPYETGGIVFKPAFHPWADPKCWLFRAARCANLFLPDETGLLAAIKRHKLSGLAPKAWDWPSQEDAARLGKPEYGIAPQPQPAPVASPKKKKKAPAKPAPCIEPEATDGVIRLREAAKQQVRPFTGEVSCVFFDASAPHFLTPYP